MNNTELDSITNVQPDLTRLLWDRDNQIFPKIKKALIKIANHFYDSVDIDNKPKIIDIILTGSLANYNYSEYSDLDLHIIVDMGKNIKLKKLLEKLFSLAKTNWNSKHDIRIKDFEVEIYVDDIDNPHYSGGVYSLLNDKWIRYPEKLKIQVDRETIKQKINYFLTVYDAILNNLENKPTEDLLDKIKNLKNKITNFRKRGLEHGGEFSTENLTFKALRRMGFLDKLAKLNQQVLDKSLSLKEKTLTKK
jgi:predicted nucleotidyltransferase